MQRPYKSGCVPAGVGEGGEGRVAAKGLTLDRKYVCPPVRMSLCLSASASGQAGAPLCFALPASVSVSALLLLLLLPFLYFIRFIFSASSRSRANEIREGASTHTHTKIFDCVCVCIFISIALGGACSGARCTCLGPALNTHIQLAHVCVCVYLLIFLALLPHLPPLLLLVEIIRHGEDA